MAEFTNVFHWLAAVTLEHISKGMGLDSDRATHELWDVIALHKLKMIVGIGTRQFERLCAVSVFINVCEEGTGIGPVMSAAAEHHPFTI